MTGTIMPGLDRLYFCGSSPSAPLISASGSLHIPVDCIPIRLLLHAP